MHTQLSIHSVNPAVFMNNPIHQFTDQDSTVRLIKSRFGEIEVNPTKTMQFMRGMLGMSTHTDFTLTHFPSPKMAQFKLLQSLQDDSLSFITLPVELRNPFIEEHDLVAACQDLEIAATDLVILLIVLVQRNLTETRLSVNVRAPLLIDSKNRQGVQHVFLNERYRVQHPLGS